MKRNREINIFSMSALDLFASAMGAFALVMIILFPYYLNNVKVNLIAVIMTWETEKHDVDLYIKDPSGAVFYYGRKTIPGSRGELTEDDKSGPGEEVWVIVKPPAGEYQVSYELYSKNGNNQNAIVSAAIYHRGGHKRLEQRTISKVGVREHVATIVVSKDGKVSVRDE